MTTATKEKEKTQGILQANLRQDNGKGSSRALRRDGKIPGILYGKGQNPISIALHLKEVTQEYVRGRFRSRLVDIKLDNNQTIKALPKDLQFNPVTDVIEHVDFIQVVAGTQLRVMVPVKFSGQDKSIGIKRGGVLNIVRHEIEFLCSPDAIPTHIEINIEKLDIGSSIHIQNITLPKRCHPGNQTQPSPSPPLPAVVLRKKKPKPPMPLLVPLRLLPVPLLPPVLPRPPPAGKKPEAKKEDKKK